MFRKQTFIATLNETVKIIYLFKYSPSITALPSPNCLKLPNYISRIQNFIIKKKSVLQMFVSFYIDIKPKNGQYFPFQPHFQYSAI